jgi:hypothetical protein
MAAWVVHLWYGSVTVPPTVLGHKFKSKEHFRAKGALLYTIYLL